MMTCDKCGAPVAEGAKFCPSCGSPAKAVMPPPPPPTPPPFPQTAETRPGIDDLIGRSTLLKTAPGAARQKGPFPLATALAAAGLALGLVLLTLMIVWNSQRNEEAANVQGQMKKVNESLELINERLAQGDQKIAGLQSQTQVMQEHMGLNEQELKRAQALARQLQAEQARNVETLGRQIAAKADATKVETIKQESDTKIAGVSEEVGEVRDEVKASKEDLAKTKAELARIGVVVTEQGTMIAVNSGGLEELRKRGEREYVSFDLRKKQRTNLAGIGLELRKADVGKQFVDFKLYVDDREMDQKKVYVNRPVSFYAGRNRLLYEVVVNEVKRDQMIGYVSLPKAGATTPTR
jgi:hypothetical protein